RIGNCILWRTSSGTDVRRPALASVVNAWSPAGLVPCIDRGIHRLHSLHRSILVHRSGFTSIRAINRSVHRLTDATIALRIELLPMPALLLMPAPVPMPRRPD